ncbi:thioredoxin-like [Rhopilema esculentum]|uniref:thioredoxin-like n=1 Tax=Rhopilema esculentum TaxID=499914 RepID=UPI0031D17412|eukprot:gene4578-20844_t
MKVIKTKAEFDELLKSESSLIVVDFFATWCGPCRAIAPKLKEMEEKYTNVVFAKVDVDENAETAEQCGINAMPTFKLYKGGKEVAEVVGASEANLKAEIEKNL